MNLGRYILDENGNPVEEPDMVRWGEWFANAGDGRQLAVSHIPTGDGDHYVSVSTVFLGLDHNSWGSGDPILWETMIFEGVLDGYQRRYTTKEAALEHHNWLCEIIDQGRESELGYVTNERSDEDRPRILPERRQRNRETRGGLVRRIRYHNLPERRK